MNIRTTLIVLLIAAGIAGYFLYFETDLLRDGADQQRVVEHEQGVALFEEPAPRPASVNRVTIRPDGGEQRVLQRIDGTWMQTAPVRAPLIAERVAALIDAVAALRYTRRIENPDDPSGYGLKPPRFEMTLRVAAGDDRADRTITVHLGRTATAGGAYLRLDEADTVYLVGDRLHRTLARGLDDLRETALPEVNPANVRRVQLIRPERTITIERDNGDYRFTGEHTGRASGNAVRQLIQAMNQTQINELVGADISQPEALETYGLAEPTLRLEVTYQPAGTDASSARESRWLAIGGRKDVTGEHYFARYSEYPLVFVLPERRVATFQRTADDLRDPRITPIARADVRRITVQDGERPLRLQLRRGQWIFADGPDDGDADKPQPRRADAKAAGQLLDAIFDARAVDYEADTQLPEDHHTVVLESARGEPEVLHLAALPGAVDELVTGESPDTPDTPAAPDAPDAPTDGDKAARADRVKVVRGTEQVAYLVPAVELTPVFRPAADYRDRTVWDLTDRRITRIQVEGEADWPSFDITRTDTGDWPGEDYDRQAIRDLAAALAPLRAEAWVDQPLNEYDLTLTVTLEPETAEGDPDRRQLRLAVEPRLAAVNGETFRLPRDTVNALGAELRDRVVLPIERQEIARLEQGGVTVTRSETGRFDADGLPEGATLESSRAAARFDALAGLKVQRYLAADPPDRAPDAELAVHLHTGERYILRLWVPEDDAGPIGQVDDGQPFRLHAGDATLLLQPLTGEPGK